MGVVKIEGKPVTLDDEIIDAGIPAIKAALSVDFPDVENADIQVVGAKTPGAARVATVVKRGTPKGGNMDYTGARGFTSHGKSVKEHVCANALKVAEEMIRRAEINRAAGVVVELSRMACAYGSGEPHPDSHFILVAGGPFANPEDAMAALEEVVAQKERVLKINSSLHRFSSNDITGEREN